MNSVKLIGHYGSDLTHAASAWTSTERHLTAQKLSRVEGLIKMLAENGHHTPFEKSSLHFLVTCDQASHIHLLKHRIGVSINAESARYKELLENKAYLPEDWKDTITKSDIKMERPDMHDAGYYTWHDILQDFTTMSNDLYHRAIEELTPHLGRARAKETARYFKTMNSQITLDVMFNWRSFAHFLSLRNKPDAQREISHIASEMLAQVYKLPGNPFSFTIKYMSQL